MKYKHVLITGAINFYISAHRSHTVRLDHWPADVLSVRSYSYICFFLGIITWGKCCFWPIWSFFVFVCHVGWGAGWLDSPGFCCAFFFFLSKRWLLLCAWRFSLVFCPLYSTLPNINSNFIPGIFMIFNDKWPNCIWSHSHVYSLSALHVTINMTLEKSWPVINLCSFWYPD